MTSTPEVRTIRDVPRDGAVYFAPVHTDEDVQQLATYAQTTNTWQAFAGRSGSHHGMDYNIPVETACAIADPTGRVVVYISRMSTTAAVAVHARFNALRPGKDYVAALSALSQNFSFVEERGRFLLARQAALYWDRKLTRGGARDVTMLAKAAWRVMHAIAFDEKFNERDLLLAETLDMPTDVRPDTAIILNASDDTLAAASAVMLAGQPKAAARLFKKPKKENRRAAPLEAYKPYWEKP